MAIMILQFLVIPESGTFVVNLLCCIRLILISTTNAIPYTMLRYANEPLKIANDPKRS